MSGDNKTALQGRAGIIALAAFVTVLAAGICLLLFLPEKEAVTDEPAVTPPEAQLHDMLLIDEELAEITFIPGDGQQYTLSIDWDMMNLTLRTNDQLFPGSFEVMEQLLFGAAMLESLVRVTENADDRQLSLFGFDAPRLIWQLKFASGRVETIALGSDLPTADGSYIKHLDNREVYIISMAQREFLYRPLEEVYDISFLPIPPSDDETPTWMLITYALMEKPDGDITEIYKRSSEELAGTSFGVSYFKLLQPFETECNDYMIQTIFMEAITRIQPASLVAAHPVSLEPYGLGNPAVLTVELATTTDEEYIRTLLIGDFDAQLGGRYVMIEGHDAVLLDPGGDYGFLDVDPHQLRHKIIWLHRIDTAASVEFYLDGISRVLELRHDGGALEGSLDGTALSEDNTRRLFTSALNIIASGGTDAQVPDVPAAYSITINLTDGGSETVELLPLSESQFLIVHEGSSTDAFITRQALFQNLLSRFDVLDSGGNLHR